ncbi:heterokaryon incompatibility protein-domain-containing protein [Xylaria sp. FL0043]|nr:heterokaryon incompatibility protein-domain-containing protein [Xylaria sp. FL0043]
MDTIRRAVLCGRCQTIFSGISPREYYEDIVAGGWRSHHESYESLLEAVQQRCSICVLLWENIKSQELKNPEEKSRLRGTRYWIKHSHDVVEVIIHTEQIKMWLTEDIRFKLIPWQENWQNLQLAPLSANTASPQTLEVASEWLRTCLDHHDVCKRRAQSSKFTPTRLLDVGLESDQQWKLHLSAKEEQTTPYMTLSHCWGKSQFLKLEQSTLDAFCKGMPVSALPQTFRDAIEVARRCSVRYIWIDSLCIMQDSDDDWRKEASKMQMVYASSLCNIAASDATGAEEGIFRARDPRYVESFIIRPQWEDCPPTDYLVCDKTAASHNLFNAPLVQRGWVLQERVLALRSLHFTKNQIFWQCRELSASENFPRDTLLGQFYPDLRLLDEITPTKEVKMAPEIFELWTHIVSEYSGCQLSFSKDKMIAICGVAHELRRTTGDEYIVGLWRSRFCQSLCWYISKEDAPNNDAPKYRAPSWSWASTDRKITYSYREEDNNTSLAVLGCHILPDGDGIGGDLADAHIILRGHITEVTVRAAGMGIDLYMGSENVRILENQILDEDGVGGNSMLRFDRALDGNKQCLFLSLQRSVDEVLRGEDAYPATRGLILERISGADDVYRRLGFFIVHSYRGSGLLFRTGGEKTFKLI